MATATRSHKKIDAAGAYRPFEGLTFISMLQNRGEPFWLKIHERLSSYPTLRKYYSPLPASSYHVTIMNFVTRATIESQGRCWAIDLIRAGPTLEQMKAACEAMAVVPEVKSSSAGPSVYARNSLGLYVKFTDATIKATTWMRRFLHERFGVPLDEGFRFHMTLAYQYREIEPVDRKAFQDEFEDLVAALRVAPIELERTGLYYFASMVGYHPL